MGVEISSNIMIRQLTTENNFIVGVEGENTKTKEIFKKTAKVIVDCTGVTSSTPNKFTDQFPYTKKNRVGMI